MSSVLDERILVSVGASTFAFHAGQLVERLLLDRSVQLAHESGSPIAKVEHVLSSLDHVLFDQVLRQLTESSDGGTAGAGRVCDGQSREAA